MPIGNGAATKGVVDVAGAGATKKSGNNEVTGLRIDVARLVSRVESLVEPFGGAGFKESVEPQLELAKGELDKTHMSLALDMNELKDQLEFETKDLERKFVF
jgi:hypothetical protein